jgi:hypothetical protein
MKAITLWPEWAWAICCLFKRVENRGWKPSDAELGRPLLIHAGASIGGVATRSVDYKDRAMEQVCRTAAENGWHWTRLGRCDFELQAAIPLVHPEFDALVSPVVRFNRDLIPCGALVAQATLEKVTWLVHPDLTAQYEIRNAVPRWGALGARHWHLSDVKLLDKAHAHAGAQRLWHVPKAVIDAILPLSGPDANIARWMALTNGKL